MGLCEWIRPISGRLLSLLLLTLIHLILLATGLEIAGAGTQLWDLWIRLLAGELAIVRSTPL